MDDAERLRALYEQSIDATVRELRAVYQVRRGEGAEAPSRQGRSAGDGFGDIVRLTLQHWGRLAGLGARYADEAARTLWRARRETAGGPAPEGAPPNDGIGALLEELELLVLRYPVAAQRVMAALVGEGRRFASTPEGAEWRERLARSELARRGRVLWDASPLNVLEEVSDAALPSMLLDAVLGAVMDARGREDDDGTAPRSGE